MIINTNTSKLLEKCAKIMVDIDGAIADVTPGINERIYLEKDFSYSVSKQLMKTAQDMQAVIKTIAEYYEN